MSVSTETTLAKRTAPVSTRDAMVEIGAWYHFIFWAAGANSDYLVKCPRTEHIKYECIGALICLTAIVAGISMFLAVSMTWPQNHWYVQVPVSLPVALIWASFIFMIDRFVVSSIRLDVSSGRRFRQLLPRLALAIIVGIIISHPIGLKIFETEIDKYLLTKQEQQEADERSKIDKDVTQLEKQASVEYTKQLEFIDNQLQAIETRESALRADTANYSKEKKSWEDKADEEDSTSIGGRRPGRGPVWRQKDSKAKEQGQKIAEAYTELAGIERQKEGVLRQKEDVSRKVDENKVDLIPELNKKIKTREEAIALRTRSGFLDRSIALLNLQQGYFLGSQNSNAADTKDAAYWPIAKVTTAILMFFILIEATPALVKYLSQSGPYDVFVSKEKLDAEVYHLVEMAMFARVQR